MNHNESIMQCLTEVLLHGKLPVLELDGLPREEKEILYMVQQFCMAVIEEQQAVTNLAEGRFDCDINGHNPLCGGLKEIQVGLRHFFWQCKRLEEGDYSQSAEFLGEFAGIFNTMKQKLMQREEYLQKSHALELEISSQRQELVEYQLEQQKRYYSHMVDSYQQLRSFRHDAKNHYMCLESLLSKGKISEARCYLERISKVVQEGAPLLHTDNYVADALLTEKIRLAESKEIAVEQQIHIAPELSIDGFDWCILLGNAMDNAIEACERLPEGSKRKILIKAKTYKSILNISIGNTALPPAPKGNNLYITNKGDAGNHGIGLTNMQEVVEKYDGVMQTVYDNGWFQLTLMLCEITSDKG